jgi:hypothetical protein
MTSRLLGLGLMRSAMSVLPDREIGVATDTQ